MWFTIETVLGLVMLVLGAYSTKKVFEYASGVHEPTRLDILWAVVVFVLAAVGFWFTVAVFV